MLQQTQLHCYRTFHAFFLFADKLYCSVYRAINSEGDTLSYAKATSSCTEWMTVPTKEQEWWEWFLLIHPFWGCLKGSGTTSDSQAPFSSVSFCDADWTGARLLCYTTGTVADELQCCFMNVQMACESASVFVGPVEVYPFNLKGYIGLGPLFSSLQSWLTTRQPSMVYINRKTCCILLRKWVWKWGSSLKPLILIKCSSWIQRKPAVNQEGLC